MNGSLLVGDSSLREGDQVQIQNYIFELANQEKVSKDNRFHILPCKPNQYRLLLVIK